MPSHNNYHNGRSGSNGFSNSHYGSSFYNQEKKEKDNDINLRQLFYTLWSKKWIIIAATLICGILAGLVAYSATPIYQSEGSLLITEPSQGGVSSGSDLGSLLTSSYGIGVGSTLANELEVLRSRKLSMAVADTLRETRLMANGRQYPVLFMSYPSDSTMAAQDTVASRIRNSISFVRTNKDAEVVNISFLSPSPYEAADVVGMTMATYKDLSTRQNRSSANSAVSFLDKERNRIKDNLQTAEENLRQFMNSSNLVQVGPQTEKLIDRMATLEARLEESRTNLTAVNSAIEQYQNQLNSIKPGLSEQYSEAIGPSINRLQYAKSELDLQKQQLLTENPNLSESAPEVVEINNKIATYKNRIKELTEDLINESDQYLGFLGGGEAGIAQSVSELNQKLIELKVQKNQYESQINVINEQVAEQSQFFNSLPDNIIDLAKLKRDVKINEELFVSVSQQYAETALWEQTQFGLGRVVDGSYVPQNPVKPNKPLYVLIGLFLGGILSVGFILMRNAFNTTIDGAESLKSLDEPLLSVIPTMNKHIKDNHGGADTVSVGGGNVSSGLVTITDNISPISESFRRLANNLIYSNPDVHLNSIMITSSAKGEGKTTTIANLGVVLSEAGYETLIVDTDFRRPNLHNMFGLKKTPGFMEVLFDDVKSEEAIKETISPGLSILSAGRRPPNAAAITQSRSFLELINELQNKYDILLIDTPPFGIITDSSAMLNHTDGVIAVAKFGKTNQVQLSQTLEQLHRLQANVMGTVLTAFDHEKSNDYYLSSNYYKQVYKDYNTYQEERK